MIRQKSEDPVVPEGTRKRARTALARGGKEIPVNQVAEQLVLPFSTAESRKGTTGGVALPSPRPWPKGNVQDVPSPPVTTEDVIGYLDEALCHVGHGRLGSCWSYGPPVSGTE
jgi:hypothetical protein